MPFMTIFDEGQCGTRIGNMASGDNRSDELEKWRLLSAQFVTESVRVMRMTAALHSLYFCVTK
jgi:hypothetical protein